MNSVEVGQFVEVRTERMATGGEAVARLDSGQVMFIRGAAPDETVRVQVTAHKKRFGRGTVIDVLDASPSRIVPSCVHHRNGECGGCDWMFLDPEAQRLAKQHIVVEQLTRLGGVIDPSVAGTMSGRGRRTTVRCGVVDGRAGYRTRGTDHAFAASECGAAHPKIEELITQASFGDATEVTIRVGLATGERLVVTDGTVGRVHVPPDVVVVRADEPGDAAIHEEVAGRMWRVSARSFFQSSLEGAEALVDAVATAVAGSAGDIVDLYAGVGLLGGGAAADRLVEAVESNASSVADARFNLDPSVRIEQARVERWKPRQVGAVIADPARRGLAKDGAQIVDRTGANHLVLVSCDPASLGRDAALLGEQGWQHDHAQVIDMFPDTSRIEIVSTFTR